MADTVAIYINGDDAVAESNNRASGIRRARYGGYSNTYSDVLGSSVHNDGEIYAAATMWRWPAELWMESGRTQDQLWSHAVIHGMNYTPSTPAYGRPPRHPRRDADLRPRTAWSGKRSRNSASESLAPMAGASPFRGRVVYQARGVQRVAEHRSDGDDHGTADAVRSPRKRLRRLPDPAVTWSRATDRSLVHQHSAGRDDRRGRVIPAAPTWARGSHTITASVTDNGAERHRHPHDYVKQRAAAEHLRRHRHRPTTVRSRRGTVRGLAVAATWSRATSPAVWSGLRTFSAGGTIGAGGSFSRSDLIVGTHTITVLNCDHAEA